MVEVEAVDTVGRGVVDVPFDLVLPFNRGFIMAGLVADLGGTTDVMAVARQF